MIVSRTVFGAMMGVSIGFLMSLFISLVLLLVALGPVPGFFLLWMKSFATGFAVSVPLSLVASPLVQAGLSRFFTVAP